MIINGELRLRPRKNYACLLRRRMVRADSFQLLLVFRRATGSGGDFVHQKIDAMRVFNQVFIERRIARQHGGATLIVDPIAVSRQIFTAMIDFKCADLDAITFEHDSCGDLLRY